MNDASASPSANLDGSASPAVEAAAEDRPEFCAITREELEPRLRNHAIWLESAGRKGVRLDLSSADLRRVDLQGARLQQADLSGADLDLANLQGADLRHADLSGSNLRNANLDEASLRKANVQDANLRRAQLRGANLSRIQGLETAAITDIDLTDASGLLGTEFAGLDITGAALPADIGRFAGLAHVADLSKHVRTLFLMVVGACVFSWLTIATTTDVALILNSSSTPLPIIQTKVPIAGFYWAAPALLLILYLYMHLSLQNLWHELAGLPAIFPDGRSLAQRAFPWMLTNLLHAYMPQLESRRPAFAQLNVAIALLTGWLLVPFTLFLFWARYLPRHEMDISLLQFVAVAIATLGGAVLLAKTKAALRGGAARPRAEKAAGSRSGPLAGLILTAFCAAFAYAVCDGAIWGDPRKELADKTASAGFRTWIPDALAWIGYPTFAKLAEARLSSGTDQAAPGAALTREALSGVAGASLRGRDLRHADASGAFLAKADLREADLREALLGNADLRFATLMRADLRSALLFGADLRGANLGLADLRSTRLPKADLRDADLRRAELGQALLGQADLRRANLERADLRGASLAGARLEDARLSRANLAEANLERAELAGADLTRSNLAGTRLRGAELRGADLSGARLVGAQGLEPRQLAGACGDRATLLPPGYRLPLCRARAD